MTGTYTGRDGREYRAGLETHWSGLARYFVESEEGERIAEFDMRDWPAAKAALDELLAEQEWVEINSVTRVSADGTRLEVKISPDAQWEPGDRLVVAQQVKDAYRKGRELALAEAGELVEAIADLPMSIRDSRIDRIRSLAAKLEAKL